MDLVHGYMPMQICPRRMGRFIDKVYFRKLKWNYYIYSLSENREGYINNIHLSNYHENQYNKVIN